MHISRETCGEKKKKQRFISGSNVSTLLLKWYTNLDILNQLVPVWLKMYHISVKNNQYLKNRMSRYSSENSRTEKSRI